MACLEHQSQSIPVFYFYYMTEIYRCKSKHCIGYLPIWIHKKLGINFNDNLFIQNYHICEFHFPRNN